MKEKKKPLTAETRRNAEIAEKDQAVALSEHEGIPS
jgi:hypothetical protein